MTHNRGMGLLGKIFGGKDRDGEADEGAAPSRFEDSEPPPDFAASRLSPHRELVHVILRDTMRKHGVPSDWIECRVLSAMSTRRTGAHVHFVVRKGHDQLLNYVFAFQDSFRHELARFDPKSSEWLLSVCWQFDDYNSATKAAMPDPSVWDMPVVPLIPSVTDAPPAPPPVSVASPAVIASAAPLEPPEDDVQQDLRALFAIRDAALKAPLGRESPGFEATRPGFDDAAPPQVQR